MTPADIATARAADFTAAGLMYSANAWRELAGRLTRGDPCTPADVVLVRSSLKAVLADPRPEAGPVARSLAHLLGAVRQPFPAPAGPPAEPLT